MRRLHRPLVLLPTLTSGAGAKKALKHLAAREDDPGVGLDFPAHWNEPDVRGALYAMHGHVCAFCLSELTRGDRGDVEHFRPKSIYFWLAYVFRNYVLSCGTCNRIFKRDSFPLVPGSPRVTYENRADLAKEARLFVDPASDPIEDWLVIHYDDDLFSWRVAPSISKGSAEYARVLETMEWFHWNKDPVLVRKRTEAIEQTLDLLDRGKRDEARKRASRFAPHGAAVRSVLAGCGVSALPTAAEEIQWLLEDLLTEWQWAEKSGSEIGRKSLDELEWAFATLWRSPPPGAETDIGEWLKSVGIKARVEPKYKELESCPA